MGNDSIAADYTIGPSLYDGATKVWLKNAWGRAIYAIIFHGKDNFERAEAWAEEQIKNKQDTNKLNPKGKI